MLILGIIGFGMLIGWAAQLLMGRRGQEIDWAMALVAGLAGSFVGGLLFSLIAGDGLDLRPSGIIGSIIGALIVSFVWVKLGSRSSKKSNPPKKSTKKR